VHNPFKHDLWIRPLDSDSITSLRSLLAEGKVVLHSTRSDRNISRGDKYLDIILRKAAPGKSRWSLPVILSYAPMTSERTTTRKGQLSTPQILAFPTLGLRVEAQEEGLWPPGVEELDWEIRYKQIDLGTKRLEECLVGYGQKTWARLAATPSGKTEGRMPPRSPMSIWRSISCERNSIPRHSRTVGPSIHCRFSRRNHEVWFYPTSRSRYRYWESPDNSEKQITKNLSISILTVIYKIKLVPGRNELTKCWCPILCKHKEPISSSHIALSPLQKQRQ